MAFDLRDPFQKKATDTILNKDKSSATKPNEIFSKKAGGRGGSGGSKSKADSEAALLEEEEDFLTNAPVPEPPPPPKPEISLFNPQWGAPQGYFNQKISISVEGTLPPESSHLTRVTFTVSALLPNGKLDRIEAKDAHLVDGKAGAEVTLFTPNYRDAKGNLPLEGEYVFKAKHRDGKEVDSAKLPAKDKKDLAHRVRLSGMLFDANKCFLLPAALGGIKKIIAAHKKYPKAQVLLVGHAGGDEDLGGLDIAFDRAQMLNAYLKAKPNLWLNQFGPEKIARSRWGTREIQLMLSVLPEGGKPHYAGNAAGITDAVTTAALKAFQAGAGLPTDGQGDFATRKALVEAYMGLNGTTLAEDVTPIAHGVEGHFEDSATASGIEADDRRLEAFFFEKEIMPQPSATTSSGGSSPYPKWQENLVDTQDFENHGIHVQIVDAKMQPVPFATVHLKGPTSGEGKSDEHGFVSFTGLKKGEYTLGSEKNGYKIGVSKLKYPTAKTVPGYVNTGKGA
ncbi:MAG: peptidoglycan-binding protein [Fibrobacteria bacterium]